MLQRLCSYVASAIDHKRYRHKQQIIKRELYASGDSPDRLKGFKGQLARLDHDSCGKGSH